MAEDGTMVWELGFLCDVPGGVSGGVFVNDKGEAVGSLSYRSEQDKMTYAICLSCDASKDFFDQVFQRNDLTSEFTDSYANTGPTCVSPHDMTVIRQAAASMKKSVDKHKARRFDYVFRKLRTQAQKFESRSSTASKMGDKRRA